MPLRSAASALSGKREIVPETGRTRISAWSYALYGAVALLVATNLVMVALQALLILSGSDAVDFATYAAAVDRFGGDLYAGSEWWYGWRYSPVAVFPFSLITWVGTGAWRLAHFTALLALPSPLRIVALASYPFWFDVHAGNVMVFVTIAAYWALRGNRWAIGLIFVMALLMPRPLMLPLVGWVLWKHPEWRIPFAWLFILHAGAVIATGYADDWIERLTRISAEEVAANMNVAPSALFGGVWMALSLPLALIAFGRGYPATAGLLLQPYWLPYYLMVLLADRWPRRLLTLKPFQARPC